MFRRLGTTEVRFKTSSSTLVIFTIFPSTLLTICVINVAAEPDSFFLFLPSRLMSSPFLRFYTGMQYQAHMSAAKAAVDAFSQCLAVEEAPFGIRSNVIAPGPVGGTEGIERLSRKHLLFRPIRTRSSHSLSPSGKDTSGTSVNFSGVDGTSNPIPLGRVGDVADIAAAAVFLFSPAATWITGTVMVVDGGEQHMTVDVLPYPRATLDPQSVKGMIAAKL
jgi:2,4-dienoyl-CoA reductase [(3E)-enoyl-CoA-producing], peroxisomal